MKSSCCLSPETVPPRPPRLDLLRRAVAAALFAGIVAAAAARQVIPFDGDWRFHLGDLPGAEEPKTPFGDWDVVTLPHDWSIGQSIDHAASSLGGGGFYPGGIGWYRRTFKAPPSWRGQRIGLEFDGVYMNADVWLNGVHLGSHPYGYTGFRFDVTGALRPGEDNVLAVRVDNSQQPNSRWYSGSGIYRHVRLVVTDPLSVTPDSVVVRTESLKEENATLGYALRLRNDTAAAQDALAQTIIVDPSGEEVARVSATVSVPAGGEADVPAAHIVIAHPHPWSPATPVRYRASTRISVGDRVTDQVVTPFGLRTIRVSADRGFELNGHALKLVGGNVHHDDGPLGAASFDRAEERKVELMKSAGFNAIRTSHNPPARAFIEACDRLGVLVLEEAFDGWEKPKTAHDYSVAMKEWWQRDIDAMVLRDRNAPSVVLWSIGNEMYERGTAAGLRIARDLTGRIRQLDPTRPITAGVNGPGQNGDWTKFDPLFATLDVAGYNYELSRHAADHARVPTRVIVVTESYQSEAFANWNIIHATPYVIGEFVWSGLDYLGEAGIGRVFAPGEPVVKHWAGDMYPWHGAACGDIDLIGIRKPASHYRAIVWDRGERLYAAVNVPSPDGRPWGVSPWTVPPSLASWTWPGQDGRDLQVDVYSRHQAVRLFLNGKLLGEKPTTAAEQFKATFAVPYAPGELKAVGLDGGRETESFVLTTAAAPAKLRLTADRQSVLADQQDLVFVQVELTDDSGRLVPTADRPVRFSVKGPATIAAVANADLTSMQAYQGDLRRTYEGRALVVLRSTDKGGVVTLTASADGVGDGIVRLVALAGTTTRD